MSCRDLGLYIHIPFCVRKCAYCDFVSFPSGEETRRLYADALIREIEANAEEAEGRAVSSIFIGGGTPSLMPKEAMEGILEAVYENYRVLPDAEVTMEMNPGTVNAENLAYVTQYVNRVSLGVQSADDAELKTLGRIHTYSEAVKSFELLRSAGIKNINIDLMSGIPGQTLSSWESSLKRIIDLHPEHISAYSLIVEEGTPFQKLYDDGVLDLPDEETERAMYDLTGEILNAHGYGHYEISNYAKPGFRCRHNLRYWQLGDYLGLGLNAASLMNRVRWRNTADLKVYLQSSGAPGAIREDVQRLSDEAAMEEFMFLGLRTSDGVTEGHFFELFHKNMRDIYGEILSAQIREGLLMQPSAGQYVLTKRGIEVSNPVLAEYLFDTE